MNNVGGIFRALWQVVTDPLRRERGYETKPKTKGTRTMIGIFVGHGRRGDNGAVSTGGVSEHTFNTTLAFDLAASLRNRNMETAVIVEYEGGSYGSAMRWVGEKARALRCDVAIELHFNSAAPSAEGYEYLFWHRSTEGERLATAFLKAHKMEFPGARNRGLKPVDASDRGSGFLRQTPCPAIICEPFFGSNSAEWEQYASQPHRLVEIYANALSDYFGA